MTTISSRFDNPQCRCEMITLASPPPRNLYVLHIPKGKRAIWIVQPVSLIWQMQSSVLLVSYQCFYTWKPSVDQALCLPNLWPRHLCSLWQEVSYVLQGHSLLKKKTLCQPVWPYDWNCVCVSECVRVGGGWGLACGFDDKSSGGCDRSTWRMSIYAFTLPCWRFILANR